MIGTLLIIVPLLIGAVCHYLSRDNYSDFLDIGWIGGYLIGALMICMASGVYINTSMKPVVKDSIQNSLDRARESGLEYELAMVQKEVIEFNRYLELDQKFWHKHFKLWINDDILELEPIK